MEVNNKLKIAELQKITGHGTIDCLKALKRTNWDIQSAEKYLLQKIDNPIIIGKIREIYEDDSYPSLKDIINQPIKEKKQILKYMKDSKIEAVAPAIVTDIINPTNKVGELYFMTDGKYGWRSDVIYYVEKYDMQLPHEFIQHVLSGL